MCSSSGDRSSSSGKKKKKRKAKYGEVWCCFSLRREGFQQASGGGLPACSMISCAI